jgi:hypothetical protein
LRAIRIETVGVLLDRIRYLAGYFPRLPGSDSKKVAASLELKWGLGHCEFTKKEYKRLRRLALTYHLKDEFIAELDKNFTFATRCPKLMRTGRFSSITGICYSIATRNYAHNAWTIDRIHRVYSDYRAVGLILQV